MGDHPLRSPTRHRLGAPLPHQLADGPQAPPKVNFSFTVKLLNLYSTCGISKPFGLLSHASGQVTNVLLTRSPLIGLLPSVRLACIRHAASVHPEPGSNSPHNCCTSRYFHPCECLFQVYSLEFLQVSVSSCHSSVVKVPQTISFAHAGASPACRRSGSARQKTDAVSGLRVLRHSRRRPLRVERLPVDTGPSSRRSLGLVFYRTLARSSLCLREV